MPAGRTYCLIEQPIDILFTVVPWVRCFSLRDNQETYRRDFVCLPDIWHSRVLDLHGSSYVRAVLTILPQGYFLE